MNILLFGAAGLLGRHLAKELTQHGHQTTALTHPDADITDAHCLDKLFSQQKWDAVINAAAICNFDLCESDPDDTARVNRDAPLNLAERCDAHGAKFVQYSSDYIFQGDSKLPYTEASASDPLSKYGEQKAVLESTILQLAPQSLILRISWLYGQGGKTFMSLLPTLLAKEETLRVASGKTGCCLFAPDAALWTRRLLESTHTGLYNLVNTGTTSWEEFAYACIEEMASAHLPLRCQNIIEVPFTDLGENWKKRPLHSSLDTSRLKHSLPDGPRSWREALAEYIDEHKSFAPSRPL